MRSCLVQLIGTELAIKGEGASLWSKEDIRGAYDAGGHQGGGLQYWLVPTQVSSDPVGNINPFPGLSICNMGALSLIFLKLKRDLDWRQPTSPSKEKLSVYPTAPAEHWIAAVQTRPQAPDPLRQSGLDQTANGPRFSSP